MLNPATILIAAMGLYRLYADRALVAETLSVTEVGRPTGWEVPIAEAVESGRYRTISMVTGLPEVLVAAIHWRESGLDFDSYLHNGQPLGEVTTIVPVGKYFEDFESAAIDALSPYSPIGQRLGLSPDSQDVAAMLEVAERYNGMGYSNNGHVSAYVWSGTSAYESGLYVKDGEFDADAVDGRPGVAAIISALYGKGVGFGLMDQVFAIIPEMIGAGAAKKAARQAVASGFRAASESHVERTQRRFLEAAVKQKAARQGEPNDVNSATSVLSWTMAREHGVMLRSGGEGVDGSGDEWDDLVHEPMYARRTDAMAEAMNIYAERISPSRVRVWGIM